MKSIDKITLEEFVTEFEKTGRTIIIRAGKVESTENALKDCHPSSALKNKHN